MIRVTILILLLFIGGGVLIALPRIFLRPLARLIFLFTAPSIGRSSSPEWISHYMWSVDGDPIPGSVRRLEEMVRLVGFIVLAPLALILIIILFD